MLRSFRLDPKSNAEAAALELQSKCINFHITTLMLGGIHFFQPNEFVYDLRSVKADNATNTLIIEWGHRRKLYIKDPKGFKLKTNVQKRAERDLENSQKISVTDNFPVHQWHSHYKTAYTNPNRAATPAYGERVVEIVIEQATWLRMDMGKQIFPEDGKFALFIQHNANVH